MVNLTNLFRQIIAPFDSSVKIPSPYAASEQELNFADLLQIRSQILLSRRSLDLATVP